MGHPPSVLIRLISLRPSGRNEEGQSGRYMGPGLKTLDYDIATIIVVIIINKNLRALIN